VVYICTLRIPEVFSKVYLVESCMQAMFREDEFTCLCASHTLDALLPFQFKLFCIPVINFAKGIQIRPLRLLNFKIFDEIIYCIIALMLFYSNLIIVKHYFPVKNFVNQDIIIIFKTLAFLPPNLYTKHPIFLSRDSLLSKNKLLHLLIILESICHWTLLVITYNHSRRSLFKYSRKRLPHWLKIATWKEINRVWAKRK